MERAPWFLHPEVLVFGQVAGIVVFAVAVLFTVARRRFAPAPFVEKLRNPSAPEP